MKKMIFKVEFLSDIILPASSNTQGNIQQLDFIPGSVFLGIAAKNYDKFEDSFNIFHSGSVRFNDATILLNNQPTYKMPLSIFKEKTNENILVNQVKEDIAHLRQAKQYKDGYITKEKELAYVEYNYFQKSAYDESLRKSKDSSMYGYKSIQKSTLWQFHISYNQISSNDLSLLLSSLNGQKSLGKSKSSQYGEVLISYEETYEEVNDIVETSEYILYANSRLALLDTYANPSYDLKDLCEGITDENIVFEKTQLKFSSYTPYNSKRGVRDYERVVIDKGSVIVLKGINKKYIQKIINGIGAYLSEGFGNILINPSFLTEETFKLKYVSRQNEASSSKVKITDELVMFLENKKITKYEDILLTKDVNDFIEKNKTLYQDVNNSQWGRVRSICNSNTTECKKTLREYIKSGKVSWKEAQIDTLLNNSCAFIKLVSMQMPKVQGVS